ncbi:MAG: hypothetical protein WAV23_03660 [Minisyncoccia bacterium]
MLENNKQSKKVYKKEGAVPQYSQPMLQQNEEEVEDDTSIKITVETTPEAIKERISRTKAQETSFNEKGKKGGIKPKGNEDKMGNINPQKGSIDKVVQAFFGEYTKRPNEEEATPRKELLELALKDGEKKKIGIGSKFTLRGTVGHNKEKVRSGSYMIVGTRTTAKDNILLIQSKKNANDKNEKPLELTRAQFEQYFKKDGILFTASDKRQEALNKFEKENSKKTIVTKEEDKVEVKTETNEPLMDDNKEETPVVIENSVDLKTESKIETEEETEERIVEILKNNKISEVIVSAGNKRIKNEKQAKLLGGKIGDPIATFNQDLDSQTSLLLLNDFNKNKPEEIYNEGAKSTIIDIRKGEMEPKEKVEGVRVFLDTGGSWLKLEEDGKTTTLRIDHHGTGQRKPTSGTKMMYRILEKAGLLKEKPEWLNKFVNFVNDFDNLSYLENEDAKKPRTFNENYFRNKWPDSLYSMAEKIPYNTLLELVRSGKIKDPSVPFTQEELEGELGKTKVGEFSIAELCKKSRTEDVEQTITGIKNAKKIENTSLGKVVYHDFRPIKEKDGNSYKPNQIPNNRAFIGTKALGYDTFVSWSKNKSNKTFFINSKHPNLGKVIEKLNEVDPGCASEIRGVMVFGKIKNLTEKQFLDIIKNPDASVEAKEPYSFTKHMKEKELEIQTKDESKTNEPIKKEEMEELPKQETSETEKKIKDLENKIAVLMKGMPNQNIDELDNFEKFFIDIKNKPENPEIMEAIKTGDLDKKKDLLKKMYEESEFAPTKTR